MKRAVYCVVERPEGWVVSFNGQEFGPAPARAIAVAAAILVATKAYGKGLHSQVLIHLGERFRTVWVNGRNLMAAG